MKALTPLAALQIVLLTSALSGVSVAAALSAEESLATFRVPDDLEVELVLKEPTISQPVFLDFDERGRMWVVQYLQYPEPAGLNMLSHDGVWRATYDKVPAPPPHHVRGADKITIHEDTDGDGTFDKHLTFVDGLNIATAVARGRGGVWVLNPPYLLFYPDANNDDVPDGDPEVHLEGFGLEDTHSVVNSLRWGPDGWLYAAQGSTVTGNVIRPGIDTKPFFSMGQCIWRYHPETRRYEIFAEGGGNAFGVEIDSVGRIFSGHNGGDTRGFHYVQGGYLRKGFEKHGPLSNPYTFGYFASMKHNAVQRFTHTFVIYDGQGLPERYHGKLFGVAPLLNHVVISDVLTDGSSLKTQDIGHAIETDDTWFRPVDIKLGPDGALYVADWNDAQCAHLRNYQGQIDKTSGRIYRIKAKGHTPSQCPDLGKLNTLELVDYLGHENRWFRQSALRLVGDRADTSIIPRLRELVARETGQLSLEALWAIHLCGGLDENFARQMLTHANPYVRAWTVRLMCDDRHVSDGLTREIAELAAQEENVEVRSQLACSARRLTASQCLPILRNLLRHDEDVGDVYIPLLLWWAIEEQISQDPDAVLKFFQEPSLWDLPLVRAHLTERLMRRFALAGGPADLLACSRLLETAPSDDDRRLLMTGFENGLAGRSVAKLPDELLAAMERFGGGSLILGLRQGRPEAVAEALRQIQGGRADPSLTLQYVQILGEVESPGAVPDLLDLAGKSQDAALQSAAIAALARYADSRVPDVLLAAYANMTDDVRAVAQSVLGSRPEWALALLRNVSSGHIDRATIPLDVIQQIRLYNHEEVARIVNELWPLAETKSPGAVRSEVSRLLGVLQSGLGVPKPGQALFTQHCAKCHKLFGLGGSVGPDLTVFKRDDLDAMLLAIVHPSADIREGYGQRLVVTDDGRTLVGVVSGEDPHSIVLKTADGREVTVARESIEESQSLPTSMMPEGLLEQFSEQDVRDLFAYLRSTQPLID